MRFSRLVIFGLLVLACSDDNPVREEPDPIVHPAKGYMYNWAGTGTRGFGLAIGPPLNTPLNYPQDVAFAPDGSPVIVDWNNHRVLGFDSTSGNVRLLVGGFDGIAGEPCGPYPSPCDDIGASETLLNHPTDVLFAPDGKMVLCAWHNSSVMLVDLAGDAMDRITGTGTPCYNGDERPALGACVYLPAGAVYDTQGRLWFTDQANMVVRMIDADGMIHTVAGTQPVWNGTRYIVQAGFSGDEGPATLAKFKFDTATTCGKMCIDAAGNIYIADTLNHAVRVIDPSGVIHRFAGLDPASPGFSGDGGPATAAKLKEPRDIACDGEGNVFIVDSGNHIIRMVNAAGIISTVAGTPGVTGDSMDDAKPALESGLNLPYGIDVDADGNLWIADTENSRIRIVYR
jgi:DNA-binding beta-propeller fold protein YncE